MIPRVDELESRDPGPAGQPRPQRVGAARQGMVSSQHYLATEAGRRMFAAGGNAMDAAVAAAFALGVVEPAASGLGGQTMMLIHHAESGRDIALDGSSRAPNRVNPGMLAKRKRRLGHTATTVPSTPAVLAYALDRYGSMSPREVLQPAIEYAEQGYPVSQLQHDLTLRELKRMQRGTAAPLFLRNGRRAFGVGQTFRQPILARTYRRLADAGIEDFYLGDISRRIVADMEAHGGYIHADDLAQIPYPVERSPLEARFRGLKVRTLAEPGAGRVLVESLNILTSLRSSKLDPDSPEGVLALVEVLRQANTDRQDRPYDRHLHAQHGDERMLRKSYAKKVALGIRERLDSLRGETTHLSAMDGDGNAVALTQSIERVYGSFAAAPELGFLYNNYMSAFDYSDYSHPYYLRPNAAPWASVAPTLVFKEGRPWLAIGSPGSERIVSAVVQVLLRLVRGEHPFKAVDAPRLHCSVDGKVSMELSRMRDDLVPMLEQLGYEIDERDPYSFYLGCVQLVLNDGSKLIGVADPRRDGSAQGV